jgi:hypothetical protein
LALDGVKDGSLSLIRAGTEYDIVYTDAVGRTLSARGDGFRVIEVPQPAAGYTTIITAHPNTGVVEHYLFKLDNNGNGEVAWGSIKGGGGLMPKSALFQAACTGR